MNNSEKADMLFKALLRQRLPASRGGEVASVYVGGGDDRCWLALTFRGNSVQVRDASLMLIDTLMHVNIKKIVRYVIQKIEGDQ